MKTHMLNYTNEKKKTPRIIVVAISLALVFSSFVSSNVAFAADGGSSNCYHGAGVLGWIACPAVSGLTALLNLVYGWVVEQLELPASSIFNADNGLLSVWNISRNISNVLFVILFLVVIISQLTGFGIDNYGIKRILPRLVVVAILINLSFIICQMAVDVSNIVGASIKGTILNIANGITVPGTFSESEEMVSYVIPIAGGAAITLAFPIAGLVIGIGLIIGLLIVLFTALGGSFTAFTITIARTIGIILCVAAAPLAFAAYLLPNTEKLFNKWLDLMKNLLLIYPICSAMLAGGVLLGKIIAAGSSTTGGSLGTTNTLIGMLAPVIPFFFIPKVMKGSLAGMGMVGQYFAGRRARREMRHAHTKKAAARYAMNAARNSQAYSKVMQIKNIKIGNANRKFGDMATSDNRFVSSAGKIGSFLTEGAAANARKESTVANQRSREYQKWTDNTLSDATRSAWFDSSGREVAQGTQDAVERQVPIMINSRGEAITQDASGKWLNEQGQETTSAGIHQMTKAEQYARQLNRQREAVFSGEQIRMYTDQFSNQSRNANNQELISAIHENNPQKFAAAFRTLIQQGGQSEALEALYEHGTNIHGNAEMRRVAEQEMAGAGNPIMKEYVKAAGNGFSGSFADFVNDTGDDGLSGAFKKKGDSALVGMDKDNLGFINEHNVQFSARSIANAASATTNGEEVTKFAKMISKLDKNDRDNIINNMSADQFVHMNNEIRVELAGIKGMEDSVEGREKYAEAFKAQLDEISKNDKLRSRMSESDRSILQVQGPPRPTQSNTQASSNPGNS